MIVVADTGPIHYLIQIDAIDILASLFGHVHVPPAVRDELLAAGAPESTRRWAESPPSWVSFSPVTPNYSAPGLGPGETQAIALAEALTADFVLIEEKRARRFARERDLNVIGTLGVLQQASQEGFVDLTSALDRLAQTSFRIDPALLQRLRDSAPGKSSSG
jgi:predicted nucleic acid-binding protein